MVTFFAELNLLSLCISWDILGFFTHLKHMQLTLSIKSEGMLLYLL